MAQAAFWLIWLLVGYVAGGAWLSSACPPKACSGMLVGLQLPGLFFGFLVWLGIGIAISVFLARQATGGLPQAGASDRGDVEAAPPAAPEDPPDDATLMQQYGIRQDGQHYVFGDYRYDRLGDAVAYARLVEKRGGA